MLAAITKDDCSFLSWIHQLTRHSEDIENVAKMQSMIRRVTKPLELSQQTTMAKNYTELFNYPFFNFKKNIKK